MGWTVRVSSAVWDRKELRIPELEATCGPAHDMPSRSQPIASLVGLLDANYMRRQGSSTGQAPGEDSDVLLKVSPHLTASSSWNSC